MNKRDTEKFLEKLNNVKWSFVANGGYGSVYKSRNTFEDEDLKIVKKEYMLKHEHVMAAKGRILEAANMLQNIDLSRFALPILHITETPEKICLYMEEIEPGSLYGKFWRKKDEMLTEKCVMEIAWQVASALSEIHAKNVIHRDIKPDNVLYSEKNKKIFLADFDLSRFNCDNLTNTKAGTLLYSPPEILTETEEAYTNKCDLWSFGVFIFELLFQEHPIQQTGSKTQKRCILDFREHALLFPNNRKISTSVIRIIKSLLVVDPTKRPDAKSLVKKIEAYFLEKGPLPNLEVLSITTEDVPDNSTESEMFFDPLLPNSIHCLMIFLPKLTKAVLFGQNLINIGHLKFKNKIFFSEMIICVCFEALYIINFLESALERLKDLDTKVCTFHHEIILWKEQFRNIIKSLRATVDIEELNDIINKELLLSTSEIKKYFLTFSENLLKDVNIGSFKINCLGIFAEFEIVKKNLEANLEENFDELKLCLGEYKFEV